MPLQRLRHAIEQNRPLPQLPLCGLWQTSHKPGTPLGCRLVGRWFSSLREGGGGSGRRVGAGLDEVAWFAALDGNGARCVGGGRGPER
jgi:hypothetical protein